VLGRLLDESYPAVVRHNVTALTLTRLTANAAYRFAPPFLATIARDLDVELSDLGVALAVTELCGLTSPLIGRGIDRLSRRSAIVIGLLGIAGGAVIAAISQGVVVFTAGLFALALSKITFDVGLGSWIADHVPYERRGRVVGLTETSWALGLLIGVSAMGLVTAVSSWRWGYVTGAVAVVVMATVVRGRLASEPHAPAGRQSGGETRLAPGAWLAVASVFGLMAASQSVFVTFGAWLEDSFGVGTAGLAGVAFGLGALELVASSLSAARTDRWGKERSVIGAALVMIPTGLVLAALDSALAPGLVALGLFIAAFEFGIVSAIPIGAELVAGRPARGIGTMIACGTLGRAVTAIPATRLYERSGLTASALLGVACAALAAGAMLARRVRQSTPEVDPRTTCGTAHTMGNERADTVERVERAERDQPR
jgi:predicted MFS family arabinose efflux permease